MLRDNPVGSSHQCLENPRPAGAELSLTEDVTSPFQAEPRQLKTRPVPQGPRRVQNGIEFTSHGFMQGTCFSKSTRDANFVPHTGQLEAAFGAGPGECGPLWPS
jgi:hypothetical protein